MSDLLFEKGLHRVGQRSHAWLLPDGSWGWSNAGIIVGDGESLVFDTLYDLKLAAEMIEGISGLTSEAPIRYVVNSHANGDHFYGNQMFSPDVTIVSTEITDLGMRQDDGGKSLIRLKNSEGPVGDFARFAFGPFDYEGISVRAADQTFSDNLRLDVGGIEVQLIDLGPAHTRSDVVAFVPEDRVLYAGDLLFIGGTPIAWAGPLSSWIAALDEILRLNPVSIVPGHGPITDAEGVRGVRRYFEFVLEKATAYYERGVAPLDAARDLDLGEFRSLNEHGRIVQNILNVYAELDPDFTPLPGGVLAEIAALEGFPGMESAAPSLR